ncbi:MAG: hypothetical protein ABL986_20295 [Vicinamibacterales bacterium]
MVNWKRHISVLTLTILFGLPVSGLACGLLCQSAAADPTASGHHHHSSSENGGGATTTSERLTVDNPLCPNPGSAVLQQVTIAADRADRLGGVVVGALINAQSDLWVRRNSGVPPVRPPDQISPSLTATPFVLRV